MKTKNLLFTAMASIVFIASAQAQNVNIPDAYFKAALVGNASINTNMDAEIQITEANSYSGSINVAGAGIANLTGIEAFGLLDSLDCSHNQLSGLNLSSNTVLTYLDCSFNHLAALDVSACTSITTLNCSHNYEITSLDVSANTSLTTLNCSHNHAITSLDVSANTLLTTLNCSCDYAITSLDVSANSLLTYLDCSSGYLTGGGWFPGQLTSLDLSSNAALTYLNCHGNQLTSIDLFFNTVLTYLDCSNNLLAALNVSACTSLTTLNCYLNQLLGIDVSNNTTLVYLDCNNNQLTGIDLSGNTALVYLDCNNNQLISLNVSANTSLANLNCSYNHPMTSLDVSANTLLTYLDCSGCVVWDSGSWSESQLAYLNVKNGNNINMSDHSFFALCNPNLTCIEVDNASWSTTNWAGYTYLVELYLPGDPSTSYTEEWFQGNTDAQSFFSENCSGVGITDNNETKAPMFYPNPTTGTIYLSEPANITLSDLSGKLLLEEENTNQLDLSALPVGMYFLNIGENNQQIVKVVKE